MKIVVIEDSRLTVDDSNQIEEMNQEIFPENLACGKYVFGKKQSKPTRCLVKKNGLIIGHLLAVERMVGYKESFCKLLYIGELMVRNEYRNKGVGKMLITKYLARVKNSGHVAAVLICGDELESFYIKCGLVKFEKMTVLLNDGNDKTRVATGTIMGMIFQPSYSSLLLDKAEIYLGDSV